MNGFFQVRRKMRTSVLIPSYGRPSSLDRCLRSLNRQRVAPDEVIVVWQSDDTVTKDAAQSFAHEMQCALRIVHCPIRGIVPAENAALHLASGEILLFIDDDAVAGPEWVARHLAHFDDGTVGAVGAPVRNYRPDGQLYSIRRPMRVGRLMPCGRLIGELFDHPPEWRTRSPIQVDHLAAGNMSFRRAAFVSCESALQPYWQSFELDLCLQVRACGLKILFDFANVIDHYPTNPIFARDRSGDLHLKVLHPAYNHALILAKHSRWPLRTLRLLYLLLVGSLTSPGVVGFCIAVCRFRSFAREFSILCQTLHCHLAGWVKGSSLRETNKSISLRSPAGSRVSA